MKKLFVLGLVIVFVLGMSVVAFADEPDPVSVSADVGVGLTVLPYTYVEFITECFGYEGLFPEALSGESGLYISDGNSTRNYAWVTWDIDGMTPHEPFSGSGYQHVEKFIVDANTLVNVELSADFTDWANTPTIFRISSDPMMPMGEQDPECEKVIGNGIGAWADTPAAVGNMVTGDEDGYPILALHNGWAEDRQADSFDLDFREGALLCQGPVPFHINGALYLPKTGQVEARDDYSAELTVTVAAVQ